MKRPDPADHVDHLRVSPPHPFWDRPLFAKVTPRFIAASIAGIAVLIFAGFGLQF